MKAHGKGQGISLSSISTLNKFTGLANVSAGCVRVAWRPLKRWPVAPHPEQARLDAGRDVKSLYS